ncbi:hypothetical protein MPTK1_2g21950 [Marchantia polymorpha subsp. ruderalis]|uniref:Uncharacterized protein n=2 Tax=Marchantia polymorpha TaxID=3197 RepID=A0A176WI91_MARPO|nr:hypothetical protein AXG93_673s1170 [Marchantia polymorpha subsp. ruderalis]PTQ40335.1 hypothetical protein MARPO_0040s0020 [Marchantia polymorpha]BBN03242.1 hypothetical protein Mp_2g21950 [Marchantia polymorpha subsp. ruderalis]|eukprot:PTQ40335.1 hypothetical protein MARPO_0040s0020 [Marchantia polymorpha]
MQPPGRDGRGNNMRGFGGGGGFFPGFPDPFAGFGGRPSFLSDMFDNDPFFSDPFLNRPFGSLFGNPSNLFGPSGFFSQSLFPPFPPPPQILQEAFHRQIPVEDLIFNSAPEGGRTSVHIEEVPDDHDDGGNVGPKSNQEPIVEHPEDDDNKNTEIVHYQPAPSTRTSQSVSNTRSTNLPVSYSYQSSSVTYGGTNGPYYASHSSRRIGPDGVYEEEHQEKDLAAGKESHKILHGLGNKGRALTRKRNAEGREEKFETLHNLALDEVQDFERKWEVRAEKSFPRYKSSSQRLGSGSGTKSRAALPSNSGNSHSTE